MEFQQLISKENLAKLEQLLLYKNEKSIKIYHNSEKKLKIFYIVLAVLYLCSIVSYLIERKMTNLTVGCILVTISFTFFTLVFARAIKRGRKKTHQLVKERYSDEFTIVLTEDFLAYKNTAYDYKNISHIVFYEELGFIYVDRKVLVFQANEELTSELEQIAERFENINCIRTEEAFSPYGYLPKLKKADMPKKKKQPKLIDH